MDSQQSNSRGFVMENKLKEAFGEGLIFLTVQDQSGGCGESFRAIVVAKEFEGMKLLERQQKVNALLKDDIAEIHALELKTWTADQWEKKKGEFGY